MASGSSKKKARRSNSQHSPSMASPSSLFSCRSFFRPLCILFFMSLFVFLCASWKMTKGSNIPTADICSIKVVNEFPHDPKAFTQGLLYAGNNILFESTGLYGLSSVRKVMLQTGKVETLQKMDGSYFGEGLTLLGERLLQVTWLTKTGFIYDRYNLSKFEKFTHQMRDGWGLATDGKVLFGSDGSSTLYQLDPQTFKVIRKETVKYKGYEVQNLNELEFVNGEVWANVWMTDCIARISHEDGIVLGWILLPELREGLLKAGHRDIDVLNGIAWDSEKNRLFVTGKQWPKLYEIKVNPIRGTFHGSIEKLCLRRPTFQYTKP